MHEPKNKPKLHEFHADFGTLKPEKAKTPVQGGGKLRPRRENEKGEIFEWDFKKGTLEKYSKNGKVHLGEWDYKTGKEVGKAVKGRRIKK